MEGALKRPEPMSETTRENSTPSDGRASDLLEGLNRAFAALLKIQDFEEALFSSLSIIADTIRGDGISFYDAAEITPSSIIHLPQRISLRRIDGVWQQKQADRFAFDITKSPQKEWIQNIRAGLPVQGSIRQFDEEDQASLTGSIIKDFFVAVLVAAEDQQLGILIAGSDQPGKKWREDEVQMLQSFAFALGSFDARRRAEGSLREKRDYLRKILDLNPNLIFSKDRAGRYTMANKAIADIYKVAVKELIGKTDRDFNPHADEIDSFLADNEEVFATGQPKFIPHYMLTDLDGRLRHTQASKVPIMNPAGEVEEVLVVISDITKQKEAEERLRENERQLKRYIESNMQLENFAYIASHDLKEPLRTIRAFSQLLTKRYADVLDEQGKAYLNFVSDNAGRLNSLIEDLLTFSQVTAVENQRKEVPTQELIEQVEQELAEMIRKNSASVQLGKLPDHIYGNPFKLQQLFQNLLSNAVKFHKPGKAPRVKISSEEHTTHWLFRISDNGIGIPEEHYERIFVLFKRLHSREKYEGTGLGLAIAKKIVEQHGGDIRVESVLGKGSTFQFTLQKQAY